MTHIRWICIVAILLTAGCHSATEIIPDTRNSAIAGQVFFVDPSWHLTIGKGVKIELVGTSFQVTSDSFGNWMLGNVPPGYYTARFSKPGYSIFTESRITLFPDDTLFWTHYPFDSVKLMPISHSQLTFPLATISSSYDSLDTVYQIRFPYQFLDGNIAPIGSGGHMTLVFSSDPHPDILNPDTILIAQSTYFLQLSTAQNHIRPGQRVYFVAYVTQYNPEYYYIDGTTRVHAWQNLGKPSPVMSFQLP